MPPCQTEPCSQCGEPRELLTINDAAKLARVDRKTIYRWMKNGMLGFCVLPSGLLRIFKDSLIRRPGTSPRHEHPEREIPECRPGSLRNPVERRCASAPGGGRPKPHTT